MSTEAQFQELLQRVEALEIQARAATDYVAICNLQAAYGYYVDKTLYDEAADLFSANARLEIAGPRRVVTELVVTLAPTLYAA